MKRANLENMQSMDLRHVALIPDGNGRWAKAHGLPLVEAHRRGARSVKTFLNVCIKYKVAVATVWAFSTENWRRSTAEVKSIMRIINRSLEHNRKLFRERGIRVKIIGRRDRIHEHFPSMAEFLSALEEETSAYQPFTFNLALDYGGRDEIVRAVRRLVSGGISEEGVTWEAVFRALDTAGQPDPDLIIRTSGEQRLSGLMPLQSEYAELHFISDLLPDVTEETYERAFAEYAHRQRRFGGRIETIDSQDREDK